MLAEVDGRIHGGVRGFWDKYFHDRPCAPCGTILVALQAHFPSGPTVFRPHPPGPPQDLDLDLFLVTARQNTKYAWAHVQAVGHFQEHAGADHLGALTRLYRHARHVFAAQPTRLFLHGLLVRGSLVELWVFDRAGLYSCEPFDARHDLGRFISVGAGYLSMSDAELGFNTHVGTDGQDSYMLVGGRDGAEPCRLYLEREPMAFPRRVVSQAPVCYRAKRRGSPAWEFVLKLCWRPAGLRAEQDMLRLVEQRNVWGVVRLFHHQQLDFIAHLRQDLRLGAPHVHDAVQLQPDARLHCLVMSPLGRALDKFDHVVDCIRACRDAVRAHRSLYLHGGILHQDVSKDNIIIPETRGEGDACGVLIDLDSAMELAHGPQKPGELIGTKPFMAIDLLRGSPHTYRHDLESFLYVFLWIAICGGHKRLPPQSRLHRWQAGTFEDAARSKAEHMAEDEFRAMLCELSPAFRGLEGLAWDLRRILFLPASQASLRTGTGFESGESGESEVERLYADVADAFDRSASRLAQVGAGAGAI
ncbi:hypothetical protein G6O67_008638 [Ophiocordyceps sinensis]|uniref:Fungal-type protein kinase domain-containing protein n=2 Tax=Ophiocordyceps sinensis TaxID=72228 RepID=A0A8H4LRW5_9HYPO|nr:serine/threonine-protein kinase Sgk2 [Ophiocordyceps sinensis CO18]KAF4504016.1 hypothetical protein G6O67_008638 [Ophiocordyceps sinensis]